MTANQFRQVLRTYYTQRIFWLFASAWLLVLTVDLLDHRFHPTEPVAEQLYGLLIPLFSMNQVLGLLMGLMLRRQFVNTQARLVPGFATAHLFVAGAIFSTAIAFIAILLPGWGGFVSRLGMVGVIIVVMAVTTWSFYLMHPTGTWLCVILIVATSIIPRQYGTGMVQWLSDSLAISLALACVGLIALAALGVRLWMLREEMPEYSRPIPAFRWNFESRVGFRNQQQWEAQKIARSRIQGWVRDVLFRLVIRRSAALGPWRRLLLRQLSGGFSGLFFIPLQIVMVLWVFWIHGRNAAPLNAEEIFVVMLIPFLMGVSMYGGYWLRRMPYFAGESLRPLGRRDYVHDLARSFAFDMMAVAVGHCMGILVGLLLFRPQGTLLEMVPLWLALTMIQYVICCGIAFWLISFRSYWVFLLGILPVIYILPGLSTAVLFAGQGFWGPVTILSAILLTALTVVLLYRMAFRRWCRVDFG